jgi:hypothetical protein
MARTLLLRMASGVTSPAAELINRATRVIPETIALTEGDGTPGNPKRDYTGTITAAAGTYDINLKSNAAYIGGDAVVIGATDNTRYDADSVKLDLSGATVGTVTSLTGYVAPDNSGISEAVLQATSAASGVATLLSRITSTLFAGITSLGGWLRILSRKDAAAATDYAASQSEINVNGGSGAGNFTNISESLEAIALTTAGDTTLVINADSPELETVNDEGTLITIHRGDYTRFRLTLGSVVGRTGEGLIFTIKDKLDDDHDSDDDSEATMQITEESGAITLNEEDYPTPGDGSLVVIDEDTGETEFTFKSDLTYDLPVMSGAYFDVQMTDSESQSRTKIRRGRVNITRDVTRRTSV